MTIFIVRDQRALMLTLMSATPPGIAWVNAAETYDEMDEIEATLGLDAPERDRPAVYLRQISAPRLRIDDPDFALDAFFAGMWFVSARMRAALALTDEDVVYRTADVTGSALHLPTLGYAAMAPVHHADGIDPTRSDIERIGSDGPLEYWQLAMHNAEPPKVALRDDFVAPAPLFYMDRTDWLAITAEAVDRVRSAGIDSVDFDNPFPAYGSWMAAQ